MKECLIKDGIDALFYNEDKKEIEIMNGKFVDKLSDEPIMNKVVVSTSTFQAGQSIN